MFNLKSSFSNTYRLLYAENYNLLLSIKNMNFDLIVGDANMPDMSISNYFDKPVMLQNYYTPQMSFAGILGV